MQRQTRQKAGNIAAQHHRGMAAGRQRVQGLAQTAEHHRQRRVACAEADRSDAVGQHFDRDARKRCLRFARGLGFRLHRGLRLLLRTRLAAETLDQRRKRLRHVLFQQAQRFARFCGHVRGQRQRDRHGLLTLRDREGPALVPQRASVLAAADVQQIVRAGATEARRQQSGFGQRRMEAVHGIGERIARFARADHEVAERTQQEAGGARIALHHRDGRQREPGQRAIQPGVDGRVQRRDVARKEAGPAIGDQQHPGVRAILHVLQRLQQLVDDHGRRRVLRDGQCVDAVAQRVQIDADLLRYRSAVVFGTRQGDLGSGQGSDRDHSAGGIGGAQHHRRRFFDPGGCAHDQSRRAQERDLAAGFRRHRCRRARFGGMRFRGMRFRSWSFHSVRCGHRRRRRRQHRRRDHSGRRAGRGGNRIRALQSGALRTRHTRQAQAAHLQHRSAERIEAGHIPARCIGVGAHVVFAPQHEIALRAARAEPPHRINVADLPVQRRRRQRCQFATQPGRTLHHGGQQIGRHAPRSGRRWLGADGVFKHQLARRVRDALHHAAVGAVRQTQCRETGMESIGGDAARQARGECGDVRRCHVGNCNVRTRSGGEARAALCMHMLNTVARAENLEAQCVVGLGQQCDMKFAGGVDVQRVIQRDVFEAKTTRGNIVGTAFCDGRASHFDA